MIQQGWLKHPGVSPCPAGTRMLSQIPSRANALTSSWWLFWITFCSLTMDTGHQMCFFIYSINRKELAVRDCTAVWCTLPRPSCPAVLIKSLQQPHPLVQGSLPMCFGLVRRYQHPWFPVFLSFLKSDYSWGILGPGGAKKHCGQAALVEHQGMVGMEQHCIAELIFIMLPTAKVIRFAF